MLQLENVEILDENYINKYFGSAENDSTTRTLPKVSLQVEMIIMKIRFITYERTC